MSKQDELILDIVAICNRQGDIDLSGCTGLTSVDGLTAKEIYVVQGIPIPNVLKNIENIRTKY